jgi:hypothetical protein
VPPVALGIRGDEVLFTYVKPCHGTFVMGVDSSEEIARLRERGRRRSRRRSKRVRRKVRKRTRQRQRQRHLLSALVMFIKINDR